MSLTQDDIKTIESMLEKQSSELQSDMSSLKDELRADMSSLKDELRADMSNLKDGLQANMENIKDQIIRAFGMTEENIRQDATHVDEHAALKSRVARIEQHVGLDTATG